MVKSPLPGDWIHRLYKSLTLIGMTYDEEFIKSFSKQSFKKYVKKKTTTAAFSFLLKLKNNQSKLKYIRYPKFIIQPYLRNSLFNKEEAIFLANARSRMLNVRHNRKNLHTDLKCPLGCYHDDKQEELLNCFPLITQLT